MAGIHEPVMSWLVEVYKDDDTVFGEALQLLSERDQVSVYTLYVHYSSSNVESHIFTAFVFFSPIKLEHFS